MDRRLCVESVYHLHLLQRLQTAREDESNHLLLALLSVVLVVVLVGGPCRWSSCTPLLTLRCHRHVAWPRWKAHSNLCADGHTCRIAPPSASLSSVMMLRGPATPRPLKAESHQALHHSQATCNDVACFRCRDERTC